MPPAEELFAENQKLQQRVAQLTAQVAYLQKQLFGGGKSERMDRSQLLLKLTELEKLTAEAAATQQISYERKAPKARPLPAETFANLPIDETIEIIPAEVKAHPELYERIGEEQTFEVDVTPPKLFKREIIRPKYRRKDDRSVAPIVAPAPARPVAGGYASAGLLAWIAISKYVDHLPLYRLEQMSARWGAAISRQSMSDWIETTAEWLEPVYRQMYLGLLAGGYLQADETPIKCHDPDQKKGKTSVGWLWVISRPGGDVVFDWRMSRREGELTTLLDGYRGILQSDGYAAYPAFVADNPGVIWVACWAHARRKYFEAQTESPKAVRVVLRLIAVMYRLERKWDEEKATPEQRAKLRQSGFARTLKWLHAIAISIRARALPKSGLGKASDYLLRHWQPLTAHLQHGVTRLDNNLIENAIRPSAIGKKNFLFVGHPDAGQRTAIIYSIVVSCQRHGKDPLAYIRDLLTRLPNMTNQDDLELLTPANWTPTLR